MAVEHPVLAHALAAGRVGHAYAFVGSPGAGRRTAARAFAGALLGAAGAHPDLHVIAATPPEDRPKGPAAIRIDDIRALERAAALRPVRGPWKVFIVEDADRMTGDAPQAFLKTLEEPPPGTVIILILTRTRAVPATVLSRCQLVRFHSAPSPAAAADRARVRAVFQDVAAEGVDALFRHAQAVDRDRPRAEALLEAIWVWYRDLLRAKAGWGLDEEVAREAQGRELDEIFQGLALCREAWRALGVNVSPRLTLEVVLSRLALGAG
jgi:DNA polymerase III delta subunit-like protein